MAILRGKLITTLALAGVLKRGVGSADPTYTALHGSHPSTKRELGMRARLTGLAYLPVLTPDQQSLRLSRLFIHLVLANVLCPGTRVII